MNAFDGKRTLASRRVSKLTLAVILKDEARPDRRPDGDIFLKAGGVDRKPALYGVYPLIGTTGLDPKNPFREIPSVPTVSPWTSTST